MPKKHKIKISKEIPTESDVIAITVNTVKYELQKDEVIEVPDEVYQALKDSSVNFEEQKKKEKKSDK